MRSNLDLDLLEELVANANAIVVWVTHKDHPDSYANAQSLESTRDFVHTLDLLETVLTRFAISARLVQLALREVEKSTPSGGLGWEFWQIDIEEYFATSLLELCYDLSNGWAMLQTFAERDAAYRILKTKHCDPGEVMIARHKATHFQPDQFERHRVAQTYSILRRPFRIVDGRLKKELAKETMPRVAELIHDTVSEAHDYVLKFRDATVGQGG